MVDSRFPTPEEVDELIRNAELRTELEPYYDESISRVNVQKFSLKVENEFLASMLAWETAPILPIYRWFEPELRLPKPESIKDEDLPEILWSIIDKLYQRRVVLDFTDHLSDRELYTIIYRDIMPAREKKIDLGTNFLHWDCAHAGGDPSVWLKYYATERERQDWAETYHQPLPPRERPLHKRNMPTEVS